MVDSPALNANSRKVLISLAPEPTVATSTNLPPPAINHPAQNIEIPESAPNEPSDEIQELEDAQDNTEYEEHDPYANLDGAFSKYIPDEPRPVQNVHQTGLDDDLLL